MEFIILGIIIYIIYQVFKGISSPKRKENEISVTFEISGSNDYETPKGKPAKWIKSGETIKVQGHEISSGLIYFGEKLLDNYGYDNDACLIHPKKKASSAEPWEYGDEMGYWPSYSNIPVKCRGAYLKWLATGRSEPETYIGYVFLFFYGLERRLFVDGLKGEVTEEERLEIINEVRRLLNIYGNNRSFRGYANNFLAMEWVFFQNDKPIPNYIDFNNRFCSEPFQVVLARKVVEGEPIPAELAIQWLHLHPEFGLRTPARRCAKEFKKLFEKRYKDKYKDGIVVKPNKTPLNLEYRAASPSLRGKLKLNVPNMPNPFILKGPVNKISDLAEEVTVELEPYSRFIGRKDNKPESMAGLSLLPKELLIELPEFEKARSTLSQACSRGPVLLDVKKFYDGFGETVPLSMSKKDSETLARFVEGLGFGIAPDVRYHNIKPTPEGKVAIFPKGHGVDFRPTREYRTLGTIMRLGAMVSQIDEEVSPHEEAVLESLIKDNRELTGIEKDSLIAYLKWALKTPQGVAGLKQRLADLSKDEKTAISHILISVAHSDGRIDPKEIKQLEKLYIKLGLDKSQVTSDLHVLAAASEPVTIEKKDKDTSHSIPAHEPTLGQGFSLDKELIRIREAETKQVKGVLEDIFTEQTDDEPEELQTEIHTTALISLDKAHQDFLQQLLKQETWERKAIHDLCKDLGLMVDGAMEVINEWAFDNVNAPLIEDGDPIFVDTDLAREMINA